MQDLTHPPIAQAWLKIQAKLQEVATGALPLAPIIPLGLSLLGSAANPLIKKGIKLIPGFGLSNPNPSGGFIGAASLLVPALSGLFGSGVERGTIVSSGAYSSLIHLKKKNGV